MKKEDFESIAFSIGGASAALGFAILIGYICQLIFA